MGFKVSGLAFFRSRVLDLNKVQGSGLLWGRFHLAMLAKGWIALPSLALWFRDLGFRVLLDSGFRDFGFGI